MEIQDILRLPRMSHAPMTDVNSPAGLYSVVSQFFKPHFQMVEVGSFEGVSTLLFSKLVNTVYSVDCYDYKVPETGRIAEHDKLFRDAEIIFDQRTKGVKNIVKIRKPSIEAALMFNDKSLDAVYIDAEHDEDSVRADINAWRPKVKFGGFLCGHDYYMPYIQKILMEEHGLTNITVSSDSSWVAVVPSVTLAAVACTKVQETIDAIRKCQEQMTFTRTVLFTHEDVQLEGIDVVKIEKLDYKGYNEFVAMKLWQYIGTDYALVVQNDGYILNGSKWDDKWLQWDYIGAGWPVPSDEVSYRTPSGRLVRVGNGGFSFRSRKLLRAPTLLGLEFTDNGSGFWHEDGFLCVHNGDLLEDNGIKFAPLSVAVKFSRELPIPELEDKDTFGFHKYL